MKILTQNTNIAFELLSSHIKQGHLGGGGGGGVGGHFGTKTIDWTNFEEVP